MILILNSCLGHKGTKTVKITLLRRTTASSPYSERAGCRLQGHAGSKTLHQQNPPVLNWRCRLTQVDLYNGRKTVVDRVWIIYLLGFFCSFAYLDVEVF